MLLCIVRLLADDHKRRNGQTELTNSVLSIPDLSDDWFFDAIALEQQSIEANAALWKFFSNR